jgi:glycerol-3-phosphate acyltransferase PlsY
MLTASRSPSVREAARNGSCFSMSFALEAALVALAFVAGTIPFGVIVARRRGVDIQRVGSGNIGATNVARNLGKRLGGLVLLLDALKGALPLVLCRALGTREAILGAAALAAIAGHCFTPWLKFRGGKGVATALGAFVVFDPFATSIAVALFAVAYALLRRVSLGSLVAAVAFPFMVWMRGAPSAVCALAVACAALIVARHHDNIRRLVRGEEKPFEAGKPEEPEE